MVLQEIFLNIWKRKAEGTAPQPTQSTFSKQPFTTLWIPNFLLAFLEYLQDCLQLCIIFNPTELRWVLPLQSCLHSDSFDAVTSPYWPCMLHTLEGFEDWSFIFFLKAISLPFHLPGITHSYENENHAILSPTDLTN